VKAEGRGKEGQDQEPFDDIKYASSTTTTTTNYYYLMPPSLLLLLLLPLPLPPLHIQILVNAQF
jgi:hypothetical protein